jgi:hypothetical protein
MPLLVIVFILLMVVIGPLLTIWSLNTLFPMLAIDYNFYTWLAVIILAAAMRSNVEIKKS